MKNIKIFLMLILLLLVTGCVKYELGMSLKSDKSITITLIDAIEKTYYSDDMYTSSIKNYEKLGFIVEKYNDAKYQGLKLEKNYESIDEISSEDCDTIELTSLLEVSPIEYKLFKVQKEGTKNTYTASFTYNLQQTSPDQTETEEIDYSQYSDSMVFKYTISLPKNVTIINENADQKTNDNYTLIWDIKYGEEKNISFSFIFDDKAVTDKIIEENNEEENKNEQEKETEEIIIQNKKNNISSYIISFLLVAIIITFFVFLKKKVTKKTTKMEHQFYHKEPHKRKK